MAREQIWIVHISHKCGDSYWAYRDEEGALANLAVWARQWWVKEGVEGSFEGLNDGEIIAAYFERVGDGEFYTIEQVDLEG